MQGTLSLRIVFTLIAVVNGLDSLHVLAAQGGNPVILIPVLGMLGLSLMYFYIGVSLPKLLEKSPNFVKKVIRVTMGLLIADFLLSLSDGLHGVPLVHLITGLLVTWYLLDNVNRLSSIPE